MLFEKPIDAHVAEALERRILNGLACEWENAYWSLDASHRDCFHKPVFSLRNITARWGYWSGQRNEICLSRRLVFHHSWFAVRETLLHEMAHQFTEQVLGARDEPPHGPSFHAACEMLKADPKASGDYPPLDEQIRNERLAPEDRILVRVRKLLSLAQSRNQHEAESAMAKAHQLIRKHNLKLISRNEQRRFVSIFVGKPALRHFREEYHLAGLLQQYYFVFGIWVAAFVVEKGKMGRVLEITGTPQNVRLAEYVHDFIKRFIDARWAEYNRRKGLNRYRKTDFSVGVIQGFVSKLKQTGKPPKDRKNQRGIIPLADPLLQDYAARRYPATVQVRGGRVKYDPEVRDDGVKAGKNLVIHKGIVTKGSGKRFLRPPEK